MRKLWFSMPLMALLIGCPAAPAPVTVMLDRPPCIYPPVAEAQPIVNTITKERVEKDYTKIIEREVVVQPSAEPPIDGPEPSIEPLVPMPSMMPEPTPAPSVKPSKKPHPKPSKKPKHGLIGFNGNPVQ